MEKGLPPKAMASGHSQLRHRNPEAQNSLKGGLGVRNPLANTFPFLFRGGAPLQS